MWVSREQNSGHCVALLLRRNCYFPESSLANFELNCTLLICAHNKWLFYVLVLLFKKYCAFPHVLKNAYLGEKKKCYTDSKHREVYSTLSVQIQGLIDSLETLILILKAINFTSKKNPMIYLHFKMTNVTPSVILKCCWTWSMTAKASLTHFLIETGSCQMWPPTPTC